MAIKALVIDLDGTLYSEDKIITVDTECAVRTQNYLRRRGLLSQLPEKKVRKMERQMVVLGNVSSNLKWLSRKFNLDYEHFNNYVNNLHPEQFGIVRDDRLVRLLTKASKRYGLFIFTNAPELWTKRVIRSLGISKLMPFRNVVCLECMGSYLKPNKGAYTAMLRITKQKRNEILFLDDKQANVRAGRALGIKSVKVTNTHHNIRNSIYAVIEKLLREG